METAIPIAIAESAETITAEAVAAKAVMQERTAIGAGRKCPIESAGSAGVDAVESTAAAEVAAAAESGAPATESVAPTEAGVSSAETVAAAETGMASTEAAAMTAAEPTSVTTAASAVTSAMLRPHGHSQEERERRNGCQAAHTP